MDVGFSNLTFLWTLVIPLIVLLYYFFRKKYTDQQVSSTLFWEEVMQETRVSPYLKYLQRNALFYLQMLALLLFVLALINPYMKKTTISGEQSIWIVDTSATMLAGKGTSTFEQHKKQMKSLVSDLGERPLTLITTGNEPKTIVRGETNQQVILKAIDQLAVTYEEQHLSKAIDMANAYIGDIPTSIYLFTDSVERGDLPTENENVKWVVKGASSGLENVGITRFAATNYDDETIALVQLTNETNQTKKVQLTLFNGDGKELLKENMTLKANEEITNTYEALPLSDVLSIKIDVEDDYEVDNSMITIVGSNPLPIAIDQQMHKLVQAGFQSLDTDVKIVPENQLTQVQEAIIVTNQTELLKSAMPIVLIGRDDELEKEVNGMIKVSKDELFTFSTLEDVYVSAVYPAFKDFETIATIGDDPFIQRSPKGDIVILADIQSTDWPLHPSFPLFLWSVQNELAEDQVSLGTFIPNEQRAVSLVPADWSIYSQEGDYIYSFEQASNFKAPSRPGLYVVRSKHEEKPFIVQLPQNERSIQDGTSFEIGKITGGTEETTNTSFVQWIALIIFIIILIEWEVQRRRGFTN